MKSILLVPGTVLVTSLACSAPNLSAPQGTAILERIYFDRSEADQGSRVTLFADAAQGAVPSPEVALVEIGRQAYFAELQPLTGCSGDTPSSNSPPWDSCSDLALAALIQSADQRAFVGFKESDQQRGVDATGMSITAGTTVAMMIQWLTEMGIVIETQHSLPVVSVRVDATEELVNTIRDHENIDYLEPIFPGSRLASGRDVPIGGLVGLVTLTLDGAASATSARASYRQPDGSVIVTSIAIRH